MTEYSIDVAYAYIQLGLEPGASFEQTGAVLANARAYRFSTQERVKHVERFVKFFTERAKLGTPEQSFADIRKTYHRQAMAFHPDRHRGSKRAEEQLKIVNAAYAIVEDIHREAKDYFRQSEDARREIERDTRQTTERETPPDIKKAHAKVPEEPRVEAEPETSAPEPRPAWRATAPGEKRYMAASIPRFVRTARLGHLPLDCVIACWFVKRDKDINLVYDIIMLPEREFLRARAHLGTPNVITPTLQRGGVSSPYVPQDTKVVTVSADEPNPEYFARNYFRKEFAKEHKVEV
jgi:hypothetical protein